MLLQTMNDLAAFADIATIISQEDVDAESKADEVNASTGMNVTAEDISTYAEEWATTDAYHGKYRVSMYLRRSEYIAGRILGAECED